VGHEHIISEVECLNIAEAVPPQATESNVMLEYGVATRYRKNYSTRNAEKDHTIEHDGGTVKLASLRSWAAHETVWDLGIEDVHKQLKGPRNNDLALSVLHFRRPAGQNRGQW
jgi:hypothetical protein